MRLTAVGLIGLVGCGSPGGAPSREPGPIAFSASGTGELVVQDLVGGPRRTIDGAGPFGTITFSPDGTELAYVNAREEVFIANLEGAVRAGGRTGSFMPSLQWGVGGWLWYPETIGSRYATVVVLPESAEIRRVGTSDFVRVAGSPVEPRLAYLDCIEAGRFCSARLIVERPDGSDQVVLATRRCEMPAQAGDLGRYGWRGASGAAVFRVYGRGTASATRLLAIAAQSTVRQAPSSPR